MLFILLEAARRVLQSPLLTDHVKLTSEAHGQVLQPLRRDARHPVGDTAAGGEDEDRWWSQRWFRPGGIVSGRPGDLLFRSTGWDVVFTCLVVMVSGFSAQGQVVPGGVHVLANTRFASCLLALRMVHVVQLVKLCR